MVGTEARKRTHHELYIDESQISGLSIYLGLEGVAFHAGSPPKQQRLCVVFYWSLGDLLSVVVCSCCLRKHTVWPDIVNSFGS